MVSQQEERGTAVSKPANFERHAASDGANEAGGNLAHVKIQRSWIHVLFAGQTAVICKTGFFSVSPSSSPQNRGSYLPATLPVLTLLPFYFGITVLGPIFVCSVFTNKYEFQRAVHNVMCHVFGPPRISGFQHKAWCAIQSGRREEFFFHAPTKNVALKVLIFTRSWGSMLWMFWVHNWHHCKRYSRYTHNLCFDHTDSIVPWVEVVSKYVSVCSSEFRI